ncbi:ABC transporter ATP-binding protein [Methanomassiliicoccus luminyensis]|jgi:ABC-type nitrate/sulfonate/bicarbonate transport system ATPase subunit|uniref:ABC transporter ATP-binding protein n=1 Tax=Methanomassiliicoccus luminyensis TaxID=1080712 RepID=UPI00035F1151|nr:ABC transporter ATP-binding protein [Methanomassiliicoccus luminyensis]
MIEVEHLDKEFDRGFRVIEDLSFSVGKGGSLTVIGPSGCGKTTLLYILSGLTKPSAGRVTVNGGTVDGPSEDVAFILQDFGLLPWKTVRENICLGMKIRKVAGSEQKLRSDALMRELGLEEHRDDYPVRLSGGERQRVAIGRALALEPKILLMDEPFSSLDTLNREKLQDALLDIRGRTGLTTVMVTHSIEEAVFLGDDILVLGGRPCSRKALIPNRRAGTKGYREDESFFSACKEVRRAVEAL